jgi:protein-tyrosine phosphatase
MRMNGWTLVPDLTRRKYSRTNLVAATISHAQIRYSCGILLVVFYICAMKILMVCLGNICRSPLAEGIMAAKIANNNLRWKVDSAGTNGYHDGEPPHHLSQKVARQNGIDISQQRSRKFVKEDFYQFDVIYAMAEDVIEEIKSIAGEKYNPQKVKLIMNEWRPGRNMDVPDPWYGSESGYHEVYKMLEQACDAVVQKACYGTVNI